MRTVVRQLFRDLVDTPQRQRERMLAERNIPAAVQSEVISLLQHASATDEPFGAAISNIAGAAFQNAGPQMCGPYRLVQLLGCGGMGAVYLAERVDGEIEHQVAIKLLRAGNDRADWHQRFLRERQLLAYLNHPYIARLLDAGRTCDGRPYLAMEYVDGIPIDGYAAGLKTPARLALFLSVCEAVTHAHARSIIHRDLKPSNILVDRGGRPKLLDFGIAKLLTVDETRTIERMLTPGYASPEQLRGDSQTFATDIYSLGAVLQKLLTGSSPREDVPASVRDLPADLQHILAKSLQEDPRDRYASVAELADDVRAFLEQRPVRARSASVAYRTAKLLRRYPAAASVTCVLLAALCGGAYLNHQQQSIAQARAAQVGQLTTKILGLDEVVGGMHNVSTSMHDMVAISQELLKSFESDARRSPTLAIEVAEAYTALARAQGVCVATGRHGHGEAAASLRKGRIMLQPVLASDPGNSRALLIAARISASAMMRAASDRETDEAAAESREAVSYLDRIADHRALSAAQSATVSDILYDVALTQKNLRLMHNAAVNARRSVEAAKHAAIPDARAGLALSLLADLLRHERDFPGALAAIHEARGHLERARFEDAAQKRLAWSRLFEREGKILGRGLGRYDEAAVALTKSFDVLEEWAQNDRGDAWTRLLFGPAAVELGHALVGKRPDAAVRVYDRALARLHEVKNNPEARRAEAELLAASSYPLRRMNRTADAKARVDAAMDALSRAGDYPARTVVPGDAADIVLRAIADHYNATGHASAAAEVYRELADKIALSNSVANAQTIAELRATAEALERRAPRRPSVHFAANFPR